jgi:hypothetical protein
MLLKSFLTEYEWVCGMFWKQKLFTSWHKTLRQKTIKAKDSQERPGAGFEQDALDTTIERLPELVWCMKAGDTGSLVPVDVLARPLDNELLIFDHSHNTLYVCPKDEATLETMAKFLKEKNIIT